MCEKRRKEFPICRPEFAASGNLVAKNRSDLTLYLSQGLLEQLMLEAVCVRNCVKISDLRRVDRFAFAKTWPTLGKTRETGYAAEACRDRKSLPERTSERSGDLPPWEGIDDT